MDIDAGPLQASSATVGCKVNSTPFSGGGLARYHSAPSSVLTGLLDDDFFPACEDLEFARLLADGIGSFSSLLGTKDSQQVLPVVSKVENTYAHFSPSKGNHNNNYGAFREPLLQSSLSSISELGGEEGADNYLRSQLPLSSAGAISQAPQHPFHHAGMDDSPSHSVLSKEFTSLQQFNSGLIRQSSSLADNISRSLAENASEDVKHGLDLLRPPLPDREEKLGGKAFISSTQLPSSSINDTFSDAPRVLTLQQVSSPRKSTSLLRQSSSPACLLSHFNLEDLTTPRVSSPEPLLDRKELMPFKGHVNCRWDAMQHLPALSQRKRGRIIDDKLPIVMQGSPELINASVINHAPAPNSMAGNMELSLEGYPEDIVLCKTRAKRGCATHPRSIAERERRMKISERMKKLQDLVPNLDKQASIAEMLDEVVDYVKLLQQQVQELSLKSPVCTCACQQKSDTQPDT